MFDQVVALLGAADPDVDPSVQQVVARQATAEPGPATMAALAAIEPGWLSPVAAVDYLAAWGRAAAWVAACTQPALRAVAGAVPPAGEDWSVSEVGPALHLGESGACRAVTVARQLARLPRAGQLLAAGELTYRQAAPLAEAIEQLTDAQATALAAAVLPRLGSATPAGARRLVARQQASVDPVGTAVAAAAAADERRLEVFPGPAGMTDLWAHLGAGEAHRLLAALDGLGGPGARERRRADALVVLAALAPTAGAAAPPPRPVEVAVTVPLASLLGLSDEPATLAGYGPIPAAAARALAADGNWRRWASEPVGGRLVDCGRARYRPSRALVEVLAGRDGGCRFPGCPVRPARCDVDHAVPFAAGGATEAANTSLLCRRHHRLKTLAGWRLRRESDGTCRWTSPTGQVHRVPEPRPG